MSADLQFPSDLLPAVLLNTFRRVSLILLELLVAPPDTGTLIASGTAKFGPLSGNLHTFSLRFDETVTAQSSRLSKSGCQINPLLGKRPCLI